MLSKYTTNVLESSEFSALSWNKFLTKKVSKNTWISNYTYCIQLQYIPYFPKTTEVQPFKYTILNN
jgi:hypothetical protein